MKLHVTWRVWHVPLVTMSHTYPTQMLKQDGDVPRWIRVPESQAETEKTGWKCPRQRKTCIWMLHSGEENKGIDFPHAMTLTLRFWSRASGNWTYLHAFTVLPVWNVQDEEKCILNALPSSSVWWGKKGSVKCTSLSWVPKCCHGLKQRLVTKW